MLNKLFGYDPAKTTIRTEVLAGITTFLTMSYILAVNPGMFSQLEGMSAGAVFTATALAAVIGSLVMAIWAKMPFGLAPGMGLNAFFCVYRMYGYGLFVAVCADSGIYRGTHIYHPYAHQSTRSNR